MSFPEAGQYNVPSAPIRIGAVNARDGAPAPLTALRRTRTPVSSALTAAADPDDKGE